MRTKTRPDGGSALPGVRLFRTLLGCFGIMAFAAISLIIADGACHDRRKARKQMLSAARHAGILGRDADGAWIRGAEDSPRTDGIVTFPVTQYALQRAVSAATESLGPPLAELTPAATAGIERLAMRFDLPDARHPLRPSPPGDLLVHVDASLLWRDLVLISEERRRVWFFRAVASSSD